MVNSSLLLGKARIYHVDDAINCDGSFCNVGGNYHLPAVSQQTTGSHLKVHGSPPGSPPTSNFNNFGPSRWSSREARPRCWFKDLLLLHWRQGGIKRYSDLGRKSINGAQQNNTFDTNIRCVEKDDGGLSCRKFRDLELRN